MDQSIAALVEVLELQSKLYSDCLELSQQKKQAILDNKIDVLDKTVRAEQSVLAQLGTNEKKRRSLVAEVTGAEDATLRSILALSPQVYVVALERLHKELGEKLERLVEVNETNRKLVASRLEYIRFMMDTMTQRENSSNTYGAAGEDMSRGNQRKSLIDRGI